MKEERGRDGALRHLFWLFAVYRQRGPSRFFAGKVHGRLNKLQLVHLRPFSDNRQNGSTVAVNIAAEGLMRRVLTSSMVAKATNAVSSS